MNNATMGAAVLGGYLLGRTKKAKLALGLGALLAGSQVRPGQLGKALDAPFLSDLTRQVRAELAGASKAAATSVLSSKADHLAGALHERTAGLRERAEGNGGAHDDEPEPEEEPEEEPEDETQEEGKDEDEGKAEDESQDEDEDDSEAESGSKAEGGSKRASRSGTRAKAGTGTGKSGGSRAAGAAGRKSAPQSRTTARPKKKTAGTTSRARSSSGSGSGSGTRSRRQDDG
ncbi:ABC transporter substrate-binding protein [Streptomyces sp. AMCC400023]|uniref:ABC transporter substrate-binding protein n=1 Tax=Streptomyces sp. AMCC400023 TaxID=2056258 RepID=UPI001F39CC91|nr:ABC transporter substrate-binding protein [Streptomyces sp. AMCC400023]UJV41403.1 ABC transporter substrate-binding protein [Streptomyces sp. AMCC400023]